MFKRSLDIQNHRQLFEKQSKKSPPHSRFHPWLIPRLKRGPRDALTKSRWSRRLNMRTWSNVTTATTGDVTQPMSQIISGMMMSDGKSNKLTTLIFFQGILAFGNYYALFKLTRDYLILSKIYKAEKLLIERF